MRKQILILCTLWLTVAVGVHGAVNMKFSGQIDSELRYTPENEWEGWDQIWIKSVIETGTNAKAYISFGENNTRRGQRSYWWTGEGRRFGLYIDKAYLTYTGALYADAAPSTVTIGDLAFVYHPYFLKLDYWNEGEYLEREYDQSKRGISIDNLRLGPVNSSGFYLWDGSGDLATYSYGCTITWPWKADNVRLYLIDYKDLKLGDLERPEMIQQIRALETSKQVKDNFSVGLILAQLKQMKATLEEGIVSEQELTTYLADIQGNYKINNNLSATLRYIDFPRVFDPIYRDRTPRFDPYTNEILAWNELDRYSDQKGIIFNLDYSSEDFGLGGKWLKLQDHDPYHPTQTQEMSLKGKIIFAGKNSLTFWQRFVDITHQRVDEVFNEQLYSSAKISVERPIFNANMMGRYAFTKRISSSQEIVHEFSVGKELTRGYLAGFSYRLGAKYAAPQPRRVYPFIEVEGTMPLGIQLVLRYAGYNHPEAGEYLYDEDDQLIPIDNIISARAKIYF